MRRELLPCDRLWRKLALFHRLKGLGHRSNASCSGLFAQPLRKLRRRTAIVLVVVTNAFENRTFIPIARFAALDAELEKHRTDKGFALYTSLSKDEVKELSVALDALSEPIARVSGVVAAK